MLGKESMGERIANAIAKKQGEKNVDDAKSMLGMIFTKHTKGRVSPEHYYNHRSKSFKRNQRKGL